MGNKIFSWLNKKEVCIFLYNRNKVEFKEYKFKKNTQSRVKEERGMFPDKCDQT